MIEIPIGTCGRQIGVCFPDFEDDLCIGCPLNGWEDCMTEDEIERERQDLEDEEEDNILLDLNDMEPKKKEER